MGLDSAQGHSSNHSALHEKPVPSRLSGGQFSPAASEQKITDGTATHSAITIPRVAQSNISEQAKPTTPDLPKYFFGIALSGGGSRAAAMGAAVLYQLDQLGILDYVTTISSVSGGSLPAAYYVLAKSTRTVNDRTEYERRMSEPRLRALFATDFEVRFILEDLLYTYIIGGAFTTMNRTDAAGRVFEDILYTNNGHQATFADLDPKLAGAGRVPLPELFVNATDEVKGGHSFSFTPDTFKKTLCSDLDRVPIGAAVAASAAFPIFLRSVGYKDYCTKDQRKDEKAPPQGYHYVNLFDGGASDNLGTDTLSYAYNVKYGQAPPQLDPRCLVIVIDAFEPIADFARLAAVSDMRPWYEGLLDLTSLGQATSIMLERRRKRQLQELGYDKVAEGSESDEPTNPFSDKGKLHYPQAACRIFHVDLVSWKHDPTTPPQIKNLTYQEIFQKNLDKSPDSYDGFVNRVKHIPTRFRLTAQQRDDLFTAAYLKVNANKDRLCEIFSSVTGEQCVK